MASLTKSQIEQLKQRAEAMTSRARNALQRAQKEKAAAAAQIETITNTVVQSFEVGGTAFGWGLIGGRYGGTEVLGLPGDLAASIALHASAFIVEDDNAAEHLHNFGDGSLAAYGHTMGLGIGRRWRIEASQQLGTPTAYGSHATTQPQLHVPPQTAPQHAAAIQAAPPAP